MTKGNTATVIRSKRKLKPIEQSDIAIARAVAVDDSHPAGRWIGRFAELGDQPPLRMLCGLTIAAGLAARDNKLARTGLRMALSHSLATVGKAFVKDGVDRTRPGEALDGSEYRMSPGHSREHGLQSMPSGHSAGVVAVAGAAMVGHPAATIPFTVGAVSIIAAQLPSRNHFVSDVFAGSAIGLAAFALSRWLLPSSEIERKT